MFAEKFIVIGENIHTTRVFMRSGKRIGYDEDGLESVLYKNSDGINSFLCIPEDFKSTKVYQEGRVKHFMVAVSSGMSESAKYQSQGKDYIASEIRRQENVGSDFLDLNIDEISPNIEIQKSAMKWLVSFYSTIARKPPSIDSSSPDIMKVGLEEYARTGSLQGAPMINSASLERVEVLDIAEYYNTNVVVTSAGDAAMPSTALERIENAARMIKFCKERGITYQRIYVDPLVFPISVDQSYGNDYLEAVLGIRKEFGGDIHITGGLSNVSFGLPARRIINDTFIRLAIDAGVNSGILNPIESKLERIRNVDESREDVKLAKAMLVGEDEFCVNFIQAFRDGKFRNY
ncbi:MAG: hypothetical protein CL751_01580 [Chloroflexi bacterium]|nr:hypothetical protein [Chloroflexota bacterium]